MKLLIALFLPMFIADCFLQNYICGLHLSVAPSVHTQLIGLLAALHTIIALICAKGTSSHLRSKSAGDYFTVILIGGTILNSFLSGLIFAGLSPLNAIAPLAGSSILRATIITSLSGAAMCATTMLVGYVIIMYRWWHRS